MNFVPSSSQDDGLDFVREWTPVAGPGPTLPSDRKNWSTPSPSNIQKSEKRSIDKRISRAFARYSIVFLIGIGTTLAWQSYGNEAMEMIRTEAPSLAWLLPVSTATPTPNGQASAAAVVPSGELVQQLKPMALDLATVRSSVEQLGVKIEQLAAKQDQMSHSIVLQSVEQGASQKLSSPSQPRAVPSRKPPQPAAQSSTAPPPPPATGQPLR
jgi:hypothetical protein